MDNRAALIGLLRSSPETFRELIADLPDPALRWTPANEWSIAGIITHLGLNEVFMGERMRHIAGGQAQMLAVFRSDQMIPNVGNPSLSVHEILTHWQTQRLQLCAWLAEQSDDKWRCGAFHPERGQTTLYLEALSHAGHDILHVEQVMRTRQQWQARHKH